MMHRICWEVSMLLSRELSTHQSLSLAILLKQGEERRKSKKVDT